MGWDIDDIVLNKIKKILGDRYSGCMYSMATSNSPVIIRHRPSMAVKERKKIVSLFPKNIRIEFQETEQDFNLTRVYGIGSDKLERIVVIYPLDTSDKEVKQALIEGGFGIFKENK